MKPQHKMINSVGALLLLVVGGGLSAVLLMTQTETDRAEVVRSAELVTVTTAERRLRSPRIEAQGTVIPARKVNLRPEVSGRVARRHPGLVPGGVIQEGEILLEIDPRDFELAVREAETQVRLAKADLEMEKGRQVVAQQEWERFGEEGEPPPLALREPQQLQAQLKIEQAEHQLAQARHDLERTRIRAPFTSLVQQAEIEPGELVTPSNMAATLVALDEFWVQVSVPVNALDRLAIPGRDGDEGSRAFVYHHSSNGTVRHEGRILRLLGDLDPAGRTARVLVGVRDPFSIADDDGEESAPDRPALRQAPLLLGSFVPVEFEGATPSDVIELPRHALHEGNRVYVANSDDKLEIREVTIAWRDSQIVAIRDNLSHGDRVIVSGVSIPVEGSPLQVQRETADPDEVDQAASGGQ